MRIILVSINIPESRWQVPYAAARLKASVEDIPAAEVSLLTGTTADSGDALLKKIISQSPDVVGFSLYVWNHSVLMQTARELRKTLPNVQLIAGGPEAGFLSPREQEVFNWVITGEGEVAFASLISALQTESEGTTDTDTALGKVIAGGAVPSPDKLVSPYVSGILKPSEYSDLLWELSRGCPYNCAFCYESRGEKGVRFFSAETAALELDLFQNAGVEHLFVLDPTFNFDRPRATDMLKLMAERAPDVHFVIEVRAELLNEETVELLSRINCSLQIGIQSVHPEVLKLINRSMNARRFIENVELLNEYGIIFGFDLIYGLPGDSPEGFYESFDGAMVLLPNHLDIFPLSILPGTDLFDRAGELGLKAMQENPYTIVSSPGFSEEEMAALGDFTAAFDAFYNQGKAVQWFNLITEYLEILPSEVFRRFSSYEISGDSLLEWQLSLISRLFADYGKDSGTPAALDMIRFFGGANTLHYNSRDLIGHLEDGITDFDELSHFVAPL